MIYLALGRRQLGKTTLVYSMARKCPARIILDPRALIHSQGIRVSRMDDLDRTMEIMAEQPTTISEVIVTPDSNVQTMFDHCARYVKAWAQDFQHAPRATHRLMFIVDEARFFDLRASPAFEYVLRAAPPDLINVAITAHRPSDIPTDIRAISDHWLMFRCTQEHDLKVIGERCTEAVRNQVETLNPHEFIDWDDATATARAYKNPSAWYIPLRAPGAAETADLDVLPPSDPNSLDKSRLF
jgi:hypothetical protein